jgi:hypothetical protein
MSGDGEDVIVAKKISSTEDDDNSIAVDYAFKCDVNE